MEKKYCVTFCIADLSISLISEHKIKLLDSFRPFAGGSGAAGYEVYFRAADTLPELSGPPLAEALEYTVFRDENGQPVRRFHDGVNGNIPYAVTRYDWDKRQVFVDYLRWGSKFVSESGNSFFHIGWERLLLAEGRMILHASCVDTPFGGILFSGPSGIGKSTQAELWCRFADGTLINGDRPIIYRKNSVWTAYGSPYAGSSRCHVNACCTVRAVVLLGQAERCSLRRLPAAQAFRRIFAGVIVNSWDADYVAAACDWVTGLIGEIPVYELDCTPDEAAVELLKCELEKGDAQWI